MKKIEVLINQNKFKIEYEPKSQSSTINDVIQHVNQLKGFPNKAKIDITIDNSKRDRNFFIKDIQNPFIYINFSDEIENFTIQHLSKDDKHKIILDKADACWQLSELEKQIANSLNCSLYSIKIMKKNQFFDRNLLLCQIFIYQQEIFYLVLVKFYIQYKDQQFLFQMDAFSHFDQIKQKVRQKFGIDEEIELYYKNTILQDQYTYFSQKIPQCAELELNIKSKQKLQIWYNDTIYNYIVSVSITIKELLEQLQQIYSIHENQKLQIKFNNKILNNNIKIENLDFSSISFESQDIELILEDKIQEKSMQIKFVDKVKQSNFFLYNVSNLDLVSSIQRLSPFIEKKYEFFINDKKLQFSDDLIFNQIQFNNNNNQIQYQLMQNQQINVNFIDEENEITTISVNPQEIIDDEMKKRKYIENVRIKAYKQGQLLDLNGTYESENIRDGDTIRYYQSEILIQIMIRIKNQDAPQIILISINYASTVKDLIQKISSIYKINCNCKILYNEQTLNNNDRLNEFPKDAIFRISKEITLKFQLILENNIEQQETQFYETDKISIIKNNFMDLFCDEVSIVDENNKNLDDCEEISKYQTKVLKISKKNVDIKYKFQNTQPTYEFKDDKRLTVKQMLEKIANRKSRCFIDLNCQDENTQLKDLKLDLNTIIIIECSKRAQLIEQNNNTNKIELTFYPEEIIDNVIKFHIKEKIQLLFNNQVVNIQNSFRNEKIESDDILYYSKIMTIQFIKYDTKQFLHSEICNQNAKISEIIKSKNFQNSRVYYQNKEINQDRTLIEEGVIDNSTLEIEETQKNLKLHIDGNVSQISVKSDMDIKTLKQQQKLINEYYQLFEINNQNQALLDNVLLKTLINRNNEIELIYKQNKNFLKITLYDAQDDKKYTEYVLLNSQVQTFIQEFQNKYNMNNIIIFLQGEEVNNELFFSQIPLDQNDEFEIVK
ncbi:unnamed protein product [Paramecium sonneborni]|uniref:Ubiquitin-like domain-containing protein n=1 Tax=Paramecium sonneborni TaxID=65129 RepID=A0A8S1QZF0_9CILI|nr:unnamed protein product [Paramecium sonneborni]